MNCGRTLLFTALLLFSFSLFSAVYGQPTISTTVKLNAFSLQVTCPAEVTPGSNVTVNVQGNPTGSGAYIQSLTVTLYYANASSLHQFVTENLVLSSAPNAYNNYISYGISGSFSKSFTLSVPENASGTLVSLFSEALLPRYQGWTPYSSGYPYYPYSSSYPYYPYSSSYPFYPYSSGYPYSYSSDQAIATLSYIQAST